MDVGSEHLFTDPALAENERGRRRRGRQPRGHREDGLERIAVDDGRSALAVSGLVRRQLSAHRGVLQRAIEPRGEVVEVEGFFEKVRCATPNGLHRAANLGARSHHQNGGSGIGLEGSVEDLEPFTIGQVHVEEHRVVVGSLERPHGGSHGADGREAVSPRFEQRRQHRPNELIIVDDENTQPAFRDFSPHRHAAIKHAPAGLASALACPVPERAAPAGPESERGGIRSHENRRKTAIRGLREDGSEVAKLTTVTSPRSPAPGITPPPRSRTESSGDRPLTSEPPPIESFARQLHRASELLRDRNPAEASHHLEHALRLVPDNAAARNLLALSFFQLGQLERALVLYEALLLDFPESVAAKVNLALALLKLGRASAARPLLEDVVRASPSHQRAWGYLGVAFEQLGLLAQAEGAFVAGHYGSAAKRLRERHATSNQLLPEVTRESARTAMPAYRRRKTLPPDIWGSARTADGSLAYPTIHQFSGTLRPPEIILDPRSSLEAAMATQPAPATPETASDVVEEIPFEHTTAPNVAILPPTMSQAPKQNRPVVPLLDAALSSLLVVPHEATVVGHPTGLVLVGMVQGPDPLEGGFGARADTVHALAGGLRREPLSRRTGLSPEPFRRENAPFLRVFGTGQLVLAPPRETRLLPLDMDADVAFLRGDLVVAFDLSLLCDLGRMRRSGGGSLALVQFRGDGVIVLALDRPFLALDVYGDATVTLRAESLIGWIGLLAPPSDDVEADGDDFLTFSGEGTLLFHAPHDK